MLKFRAVMSSSPVELLDGWRLYHTTGLSLFSTLPDAAAALVSAAEESAAAVVSAAEPAAAVVEELEEPPHAAREAAMTALMRIAACFFI